MGEPAGAGIGLSNAIGILEQFGMRQWRFGDWTFSEWDRMLRGPGTSTQLRGKTAELLSFLLEAGHRVLSKESILSAVWSDRVVSDNTLMQSIRELRVAFVDDAAKPRFVETLRGRGYRWVGPVAQVLPDGGRAPKQIPAIRRWPPRAWVWTLTALILAGVGARMLSTEHRNDATAARSAFRRGESAEAERTFDAILRRRPSDADGLVGMAAIRFERGNRQAAEDMLRGVLFAGDEIGPATRLPALELAGDLAYDAGELDVAERRYREALDLARAQHDGWRKTALTTRLSVIAAERGSVAEYLLLRARAADLREMRTNDDAYAAALMASGTLEHGGVAGGLGIPELREALELFVRRDEPRGMAAALRALGRKIGLPLEARRSHLERALRLYDEIGDVRGRLHTLLARADVEIAGLQSVDALDTARRCVALSSMIDSERMKPECSFRLGMAVMLQMPNGDKGPGEILEASLSHYESAHRRFEAMGITFDRMAVALHREVARLELGAVEAARQGFQNLAARYEALPFRRGVIGARLGEAAAGYALGEVAAADAIVEAQRESNPSLGPILQRFRALHVRATDAGFNRLFRFLITAEPSVASGGASIR